MGGIRGPGRSNARTGAKHAFVRAVVGALTGMSALDRVRAKFPGGHTLIDMTAGDVIGGLAAPLPDQLQFDEPIPEPDGDASHALLVQYAEDRAYIKAFGAPASVYLFERDTAQADRLATFYRDRRNVIVTNGLSHELVPFRVPILHRGSLVIVDDPNSTASSTLTPDVVRWAFDWAGTTLIACMGVNAAGAARDPAHYPASREQYQRVIDAAEEQGGRYIAAARLANDSHRWGYMVVTTASARGAVDGAIRSMGSKTQFRIEPAYGVGQVEQMLDALHTPRKASV